MFDWKKICSDEEEFPTLFYELEHSSGKLIFDNVRFPKTCGNAVGTVCFCYYSHHSLVITYEGPLVRYRGAHPEIEEWFVHGRRSFCSFEELTDFLRLFQEPDSVQYENADTEYEEPVRRARPDRPIMQYNRDAVAVPNTARSYLDIDRERLITDLKDEIFGQDDNILKIAHLVSNHLGTKNKIRPLTIFLYGSTGTGKSCIAKELVKCLNNQMDIEDPSFAYRPVDCTQFQERYDISRLIGAAPGYVGFNEPGVFSILERNPYTVFVFEEIEKAAPNVTEVIMQAMETGRQETNGKTLANGKDYYDLSHCIIFFTSNITIKEKNVLGFLTDEPANDAETQYTDNSTQNIARMIGKETKRAKEILLENRAFRQEIIGRMQAIFRFHDLTGDVIKDIAAKCIREVAEQLHRLYITSLGADILQEFLNETAGEINRFGVRSLRSEAEFYFNDALREYSHSHDDYDCIHVDGTLDSPLIEPDM